MGDALTGGAEWSSAGKFGVLGVRRVERKSRRAELGGAAAQLRDDARGMGEARAGLERLARHRLQGNRQLQPRGNHGPLVKAAGAATIGGSRQRVSRRARSATNAWSHLAVTYDGSNLSLYVNGNRISRKKVSGTITRSSSPLQIGGDSVYGQNFAGTIDEVRIYNIALSASAIQNDMQTALGGAPTPPAPDTVAPSTPTGLSTSAVGEDARNADLERLVRQRRSGRLSDLP